MGDKFELVDVRIGKRDSNEFEILFRLATMSGCVYGYRTGDLDEEIRDLLIQTDNDFSASIRFSSDLTITNLVEVLDTQELPTCDEEKTAWLN